MAIGTNVQAFDADLTDLADGTLSGAIISLTGFDFSKLASGTELEIIAENKDGLKASSKRTIHVGATVLADASKIKRTDYALIFCYGPI